MTVEAVEPYEGRFGPAPDLRRLSGRGALINGGFQVGLALVTLLRGLAVAAFVTEAEYGLWGLVALAALAALTVRSVGVNQKYVQQSAADQRLAFQLAFTVELIFAAVGVAILVACVPLVALVTGQSAMLAPGFAMALIIPAGALQFPVWAFHRRMDFRRQRALQAVEPIVGAGVMVSLAIAGAGYWSFVGGVIVGAWAGALAALRSSPYPFALRPDRSTTRTYLQFSRPLVVTAVAVLAMFAVIYLLGEESLGLAGLGAYTLAGNILAFTDRADGLVTEALYPALCAVRDRASALYEAFVKSNRLALLWAAPFGLGLSLFADDLVTFGLGARWTPAIGLLQVMGIVAAVHQIGSNWHAFYRALGDTRPIAVSAVAGIGAFIAAAVPLMASDGLTGLAWAFVLAEVVGLGTRIIYLRRLFPGRPLAAPLLRSLVPAVAAAALLALLRAALDVERTGAVALAELVGFALAVGACTLVCERALLREALGYALKRRG